MSLPNLSIIIPVYNVEKYIHNCIDSILKQSDISFEIIAVDDGSPDNCPQILDEYASKDDRIKVIHQKNGGVSNARNNGIKNAKGKWVYLVDSDDWLVEGKLSTAMKAAELSEADVLFVDCNECYDDGSSKRLRLFSESFETNDDNTIYEIQKSILCHKMSPFYSKGADSAYPAPWSKLIRRSIIEDNNIEFDPEVGGVYDDGLFTLELLEHSKKVAYFGICLYNYRILSSSIVHSYRKGMVDKFEKNCIAVNRFAKRYNKDRSFIDAEYARRIAYLSSFLSSYFFHNDNKAKKREIHKELLEVFARSPWKEAIQNAKAYYLENKHKYTLLCMRTKNIPGLYFYSALKKALK